ncbi:MAG: NHL repeat-containing protein [Planctomycetota bacterium]
MTQTDRMRIFRGAAGCGLWSLLLMLSGCGSPPGELFEPGAYMPAWPPPPEPVRVRYVGQLASEEDLKPSRNLFEGIGEALFGKTDSRAMRSPYALCTDGADRVFVTDSTAGVVHVFNLQTRAFAQWTPGGTGKKVVQPFDQPVGIVYDPRGRLFVSDSAAGRIHVFDDAGVHVRAIGQGVLQRPCGLAIDTAQDRLYVADAAAHQVVVLGLDGELIRRIGKRGELLGEFNFPTNVALGPGGRLFVSDSLNFRVQVFDAAYNPLRQIGEKGDLPGYFSQPKGLALDSRGNLFVIDAHFEAAQVFDSGDGSLLMSFGREGHGPGEFWLPAGIHIDPNDRIWIADVYNKRVQLFSGREEVTP